MEVLRSLLDAESLPRLSKTLHNPQIRLTYLVEKKKERILHPIGYKLICYRYSDDYEIGLYKHNFTYFLSAESSKDKLTLSIIEAAFELTQHIILGNDVNPKCESKCES